MEYLDKHRLNSIQTRLYYNYEYFDSEQFNDQSIQKFSRMSEIWLDPSKPKWFDFDY